MNDTAVNLVMPRELYIKLKEEAKKKSGAAHFLDKISIDKSLQLW